MGYDIPSDHHGPLPSNKPNTDKEWLLKKAAQEDECFVSAGTTSNMKDQIPMMRTMILNNLRDECYRNAKDHGFWEDEDKLRSMAQFVFNSSSLGEHDFLDRMKTIQRLFNSEKIALEMSELAERLECLRKNPEKMDEHCPDFLNLEIEVADLIIRALDFSGRRNLRIGEALQAKMKYNESRTYKHGKVF